MPSLVSLGNGIAVAAYSPIEISSSGQYHFSELVTRTLWVAALLFAIALARPEDRQNLLDDLVHSLKVRHVVIPAATHFVHLDRAEHGRRILLDEVSSFLGKN